MKSEKGAIERFTLKERIIHWTVGILFVYIMLTGLALFSPRLYWLASLLGGGTTIARWHPIAGVALVVALLWMARIWCRDMQFEAGDQEWLRQLGKYIRNQDQGLPEAGRFNPGQKQLFWLQLANAALLLLPSRWWTRSPLFPWISGLWNRATAKLS